MVMVVRLKALPNAPAATLVSIAIPTGPTGNVRTAHQTLSLFRTEPFARTAMRASTSSTLLVARLAPMAQALPLWRLNALSAQDGPTGSQLALFFFRFLALLFSYCDCASHRAKIVLIVLFHSAILLRTTSALGALVALFLLETTPNASSAWPEPTRIQI